jgi:hypothetical protein
VLVNIVYKFTSNKTGKYYIGSKVECDIFDGKILDNRTGRYYFSSSKQDDFLKELSDGNLVLEVLEVVSKKENLLQRESYWQKFYNYKSKLCWNKVLATDLHPTLPLEKLQKLYNIYGETYNTFIVNESKIARLDCSAVRDGFDNNGEKLIFFLKEKQKYSYSELDKKYNRKGYFKRYLKGCKLSDYDTKVDVPSITKLMRNGASFVRACELLNTPHYVARRTIGNNFKTLLSRENLVAEVNGFVYRKDFNLQILKDFLSGMTRQSIALKYKNISNSTISRILDYEIRERLKINDL